HVSPGHLSRGGGEGFAAAGAGARVRRSARERREPSGARATGLPAAAVTPDNLSALALSIRVAVVATLLNAAVGIPLAYVLARRRFRGRGLVDLLVTLPLVLPPTVTGYYLIVLLGRRGWLGGPVYAWTGWSVAFTWYAAVIAATVMALPLLVRTARAAIESVD